jgi:transcriptional regulator with XRE-family HTH domain
MPTDGPTLGPMLRQLRLRADISVVDLSAATGISRSYITRIEAGRVAQPSREVVERIARVLGIDAATLITGSDVQPLGSSISDRVLQRTLRVIQKDQSGLQTMQAKFNPQVGRTHKIDQGLIELIGVRHLMMRQDSLILLMRSAAQVEHASALTTEDGRRDANARLEALARKWGNGAASDVLKYLRRERHSTGEIPNSLAAIMSWAGQWDAANGWGIFSVLDEYDLEGNEFNDKKVEVSKINRNQITKWRITIENDPLIRTDEYETNLLCHWWIGYLHNFLETSLRGFIRLLETDLLDRDQWSLIHLPSYNRVRSVEFESRDETGTSIFSVWWEQSSLASAFWFFRRSQVYLRRMSEDNIMESEMSDQSKRLVSALVNCVHELDVQLKRPDSGLSDEQLPLFGSSAGWASIERIRDLVTEARSQVTGDGPLPVPPSVAIGRIEAALWFDAVCQYIVQVVELTRPGINAEA